MYMYMCTYMSMYKYMYMYYRIPQIHVCPHPPPPPHHFSAWQNPGERWLFLGSQYLCDCVTTVTYLGWHVSAQSLYFQ